MARAKYVLTKKGYSILITLLALLVVYNLWSMFSWYTDKLEGEFLLSNIQEQYPIDTNEFVALDEPVDEEETVANVIENDAESIDNQEAEKVNNSIKNGKKYVLNELKNKYADIVGILTVPTTKVYYPIVQTSNNNYYLEHLLDKSKNKAGWPFMDFRSDLNSKNIVVYGHNRNDGSMFGGLKELLKNPQNSSNKKIVFQTIEGNTNWEVFSIYTIKSEKRYIKTDFPNDSEYKTWLADMKKRSIFNYNKSITTDNQVLTLSTCYGLSINNKRLVIHAKKI